MLKAKKALKKNKTKVTLHVADIRKPIKRYFNKFDTVYLVGVLGMFNTKDIDTICNLASKYLKENGKILDIDWTECNLPKNKLNERVGYQWFENKNHSIVEIGNHINKSGYSILKKGIHHVKNPEKYEWGKIYFYLGEKLN